MTVYARTSIGVAARHLLPPLGLAILCFVGAGQRANAENGWQVVQTGDSCPMGAGTIVTVGSNGMRVTGSRGRIVMVTTGPTWNVTLMNHQAKMVYQTTLSEWLKTAQSEKNRSSMEGATWKRGTTEQIARMRAYSFVMDKAPARPPTLRDGRQMPSITAAQLWVAQDIATSPAISNLFSKLYGIPDCQRLPLRLATASSGAAQSNRLDTISASPKVISADTFQVPPGYKQVSSYLDCITGSTDTDDLKKLLNE